MKHYVAVLTCALSLPCFSQNVVVTQINGQPLVYLKDGQPQGCGIRMIGGEGPNHEGVVRMFDVSINLYASAAAVVKVLSYDAKPQPNKHLGMPVAVPVLRGWIKAPNATGTTPVEGKTLAGEDGKSILYVADVDSVMAVFRAQGSAQPVNIGIRRLHENTERIYSGSVAMSEVEQRQVTQCLKELVSAMK